MSGAEGASRLPDRIARICVLVDGSRASFFALAHAVAAAQYRRATLTIVAVAPRPSPMIGMVGVCPRQMRDELLESAATHVRRLAAGLPRGVSATTVVRCGSPAGEVIGFLREHRHDVLFVGTDRPVGIMHCRGVAARLRRRAPADVVLVQPPAPVGTAPRSARSGLTALRHGRPDGGERGLGEPILN